MRTKTKKVTEETMWTWNKTAYEIRHKRMMIAEMEYPAGTRIICEHRSDEDPCPIPDKLRGTVRYIDEMAVLRVLWDDGIDRGIIPGIDNFRRLTKEECTRERYGLK